jgi:AcrR family transcriptional regulator
MAARAVFSEQGVDAQMDDVARRADVGVGTVYRHFPTKEALLRALTEELFDLLADHARGLVDADDPWEALKDVLWFGAGKTAGDRAFAEILAAQRKLGPIACPGQVALTETVDVLLQRCIKAGKMRPDVVIDDIPLVMCGIGSASALPHQTPEAWRRHLGIVLDGLRAEAVSAPLHR